MYEKLLEWYIVGSKCSRRTIVSVHGVRSCNFHSIFFFNFKVIHDFLYFFLFLEFNSVALELRCWHDLQAHEKYGNSDPT